MSAILVLSLLAAALLAGWRVRERGRRAHERRSLAELLAPEIRSILASCDPLGPSNGAPLPPERFTGVREKLPRLLPAEALFAVETFYQSVDAYADAAKGMTRAFAPESELSLGDRIRAKDRRDRTLQDVHYTGEGALERLQKLA